MSQAGIINAGGGGGGGGGPVDELTGNSGTATPDVNNNINIVTANTTVKFNGSGSILTEDFGLSNLVLGTSLPAFAGGEANTGMGQSVFAVLTTGDDNVAIGTNAGESILGGSENTLIGYNAGTDISFGNANTALGALSLQSLTTDLNNTGSNTALGAVSLNALRTGIYNVSIGRASGQNYTGAESSNILISSNGVLGESNVMRLGTSGSSNGQVNKAFVAGVEGVTVAGPLVNMNSSGQMGQMAAGTTGQIAQSAGAGATPTWSTATYPATAGTTGNYLVSNGTNFVSQAFAPPQASGIYGDGSDSTVTFDGMATILGMAPVGGTTYTLTRDFFFASCTINSSIIIITAGFRLFCSGTLTNNGTIQWNGNAGTNTGTFGGVLDNTNSSINQGVTTSAPGLAGGAGNTGAGSNGTNGAAPGLGGVGANGAAGGSGGGSGGTQGSLASTKSNVRTLPNAINGYFVIATIVPTLQVYVGGSGGGGGGGDGSDKGGGGGSGGGIVIVVAFIFAGTGNIQAIGGAGGNGQTGGTSCGGGGGGGGGVITVVSSSVVSGAITGQSISVAGGAGGTGTGAGGTASQGGTGLKVILYSP